MLLLLLLHIHTIRHCIYHCQASAPIVTMLFSVLVLGKRFSLPTYLSVACMVMGVALTSATELSFDKASAPVSLSLSLCPSPPLSLPCSWV